MSAMAINPVLAEACALAEGQYIAEALAYYDVLPEFEYSKEFEKKIEKLSGHMKTGTYKKITRPLKILLVAAIITTILSVSAIAVPPVQQIVRKFNMVTFPSFSNLTFEDNLDVYGTLYSDYTCIPKRYTLISHEQSDMFEKFCYEDAEGNSIVCSAYMNENLTSMIDTEDATVEEIAVHGTTALLVSKEGMLTVCWVQGEYNYHINAYGISKDELIKMVESRENVEEEKFLGIF